MWRLPVPLAMGMSPAVMTEPPYNFHTTRCPSLSFGQVRVDQMWVSTGCKKKKPSCLIQFKKFNHPDFFFSSKTPAKCVDWFFSREFIGSQHIDKNSVSKELRVSKQGDDAMQRCDRIPSWIWWNHPNPEEWLLLVRTSSRGSGVYCKHHGPRNVEAGVFALSLLLTGCQTWARSHRFPHLLVNDLGQWISEVPPSS